MADTTIQKQGEVFISQSEYDALRLAGNLQSNTKYHITKTPKTGVDSLEQMNLLNGDKTVTYTTTDGMTVNGKATLTYDGGTTKDVTMNIDVPVVAGEGITIDKVNGQEKVEVKLDTAFTNDKYVAKQNKTPKALYGVDSQKNQINMLYTEKSTAWTVAQRGVGGTLKVGTAVEDSDAMPKKQVEDGFVAKVTPANQFTYVYARDGNGDKSLQATSMTTGNTVAYRDANGNIGVGTPTDGTHATTKKYVDDADSKKVNIIDGLTAGSVVYATETANGTTIGIPYSANTPDSDSIVQRQQNGVIVVGTPTSDATDAAVNIEYANAHYVAKITEPLTVYATDYLGNLKTNLKYFANPSQGNIPIFNSKGCLKTNDPVKSESDSELQYGKYCVNLSYANGHYVAKIGTATQVGTILYGRDLNGNEKGYIVESIAHNAGTIVQRKSGGAVEVGTPVGVNDATTKAYVDGLHHYSHHIVISDGTSEIFITLAIKNYPNAVTTLDGVTELVFDLTEGGMQPIMATGVVYGHNVHAVLVQADRHLYANYYDSTKNMIMTDKVQVLFNDTATVHDMVV